MHPSRPILRTGLGMAPSRKAACSPWASFALAATALYTDSGAHADVGSVDKGEWLSEITVESGRSALIGTATSASEGVVNDEELQLAPSYRPGQLLETVPGLIVTLHSGEGKANQYLLRGYNLDHGTDLATFVDGMPVNAPTHAHGQGYTDLNFLVPELVDALSYTKGPYHAAVGDFGAVGSIHLSLRDAIDDQVSLGTGSYGYRRLFAAGSERIGDGTLLGAVELQHYDGPFVTPDDARRQNAVLRYTEGDATDGWSLTAMAYHQLWTNTTDIPSRAITSGAVPNRFGSLDPSDGGASQRFSVSLNRHRDLGGGRLSVTAYGIYDTLDMFSNFTHFLIDPVHGDQEHQFERRRVAGASVDYRQGFEFAGRDQDLSVGALVRHDSLSVGRLPSEARWPLPVGDEPVSFSDSDDVDLTSVAAYGEWTTHWSQKVRSVLGVRIDTQYGSDRDLLATLHESVGYSNGGRVGQALVQPKLSLAYDLAPQVEIYASAGEGFHSADLRGVDQVRSVDLGLPHTPLLAAQWGEELGLRTAPDAATSLTLALYTLWQQSETTLNPDVGQDVAGPPSRRSGVELNVIRRINHSLELHASVSGNHSRFTRAFDDGTGHLGTYITDAPAFTGSVALYLDDVGPWSGGLEYRYLGAYPLSSGPCNDAAAVRDFPSVARSCKDAPTAPGEVYGSGFGEVNLDASYTLSSGWKFTLGLFNLLNAHAPAAEFWYVDRLRSELATAPNGRADVHQHPLEPFAARFTVNRRL